MHPTSLIELAAAIGISPRCPDLLIAHISTDTRDIPPNSLFVALRGERTDGHGYLAQAAADGAIAAVVDRFPIDAPAELPLLRVDDTRRALAKLANFLRRRFTGKVIAVAGSNGKTSTKFLINAVLAGSLAGSMSPKSFNNDIGVPLAIFPADPEHDYLILEMGTNHPGEIRVLAEMAQPDIAVLTNCGLEHLEFLGDLDGVRRENAEIVRGLSSRGTLIINGDDPELLAETAAITAAGQKRVTFGFSDRNDLQVRDISFGRDGTRFRLADTGMPRADSISQPPQAPAEREWFVPLLGRHAAANSAAAVAVGRAMGLADADIASALAGARGPEMRLEVVNLPGGVTVVNDAYNANPSSMQAALDTLASLPAAGRRIAILGDMRELGRESARYHRQIGRAAARGTGSASTAGNPGGAADSSGRGGSRIDRLLCIGPDAAHIADAAIDAGMPAESVQHFSDAPSAAAAVTDLVHSGDLVLIKASRAMKLETVQAALADFAARQEAHDATPA